MNHIVYISGAMKIKEQGKLYWKHHYVVETNVGDIANK
jgi:hypothetical protein